MTRMNSTRRPPSIKGVALWALCAACKPAANDANAPADADKSPPMMEDPATPPPALDPKDPMFSCSAAADCQVVEMGCCDHCNGGWQLTVNKQQIDAAKAKYHEPNCGGPCTERGCNWHETPACEAGTCARTEDRDDDASTPVTLVPNELPAK